MSLRELERCVDELGLRVVNLPANVRGTYVGDRSLWPLWEAIADREPVVFLHPHGVQDAWYLAYGLWNSVGQAFEETRALSSMIYKGLLDHLPHLKVVVSHGGGYLPHYYGRTTAMFRTCPRARATSPARPVNTCGCSTTTPATTRRRCSPRWSIGLAATASSWAAIIPSETPTRSGSSSAATGCRHTPRGWSRLARPGHSWGYQSSPDLEGEAAARRASRHAQRVAGRMKRSCCAAARPAHVL